MTSSDFLIIGGGIAGLSAGARLSHLGSVTVLEAEQALGYHTSGRSAALHEVNYGSMSTIALNKASQEHHKTFDGGLLTPRGLMLIGNAQNEDAFVRDLSDLKLQRITIDEALHLVPILNRDVVTQVGHHSEAWDLDTDRLLQGFARQIRQNGGTILTGQRVGSITRTGSNWQVDTGELTHAGRMLFDAAGAWADQVAVMAGIAPIGLTPCRRSIARIPVPGGHDLTGWPMMIGAGETWYAKPDAGMLLVSPADEDPIEPHDAWPDDMVLAEGLDRYETHVTEPVTRLQSSWAGLRTFSKDREPVIGAEPKCPTFFWIAGQGGNGMQSSPAAGRLVADLVEGNKSELAATLGDALSPARFR